MTTMTKRPVLAVFGMLLGSAFFAAEAQDSCGATAYPWNASAADWLNQAYPGLSDIIHVAGTPAAVSCPRDTVCVLNSGRAECRKAVYTTRFTAQLEVRTYEEVNGQRFELLRQNCSANASFDRIGTQTRNRVTFSTAMEPSFSNDLR